MKKNIKAFTIVELLIVIVVIGILAAITIVSYNGITNKANTAASSNAANSVVAKAEVYKGMTGDYPASLSVLTGLATTHPANLPTSAATYSNFGQATITNLTTGMSAPTSPYNKVRYIVCGYGAVQPAAAPTTIAGITTKTGILALTWNFTNGAIDNTTAQGTVAFGGANGVSGTITVGASTYNASCVDAGA